MMKKCASLQSIVKGTIPCINPIREVNLLRNLARASAVSRPCLLVTGARGFGAQTSETTTFIEKAKAYGANALLGMYTHRGDRFDKCLGNLKIEKISDGSCVCTLPVEDHVQNAYKTLHGGAICTIVDVVGTLALLSVDPTKPGVSVDLNCNFITAAKAGEDIIIEGTVLKSGRRLGFTQVDLKHKDGTLIATGRHTKALG